jgi:hypothetical protein
MSKATKLISGILLIIVPTIEFGGTFLLRILSGKEPQFTEFQRSMFRAGHAHAGVLVILALVARSSLTKRGCRRPSDGRSGSGSCSPPSS